MTARRSTWRVPIALVALGAVPVVAGALRLLELSGAATTMPSVVPSSVNAALVDAGTPVVLTSSTGII